MTPVWDIVVGDGKVPGPKKRERALIPVIQVNGAVTVTRAVSLAAAGDGQ